MPEQDKELFIVDPDQLADASIEQSARQLLMVSGRRRRGETFNDEMSALLSSAALLAQLTNALLEERVRAVPSLNGHFPVEQIPAPALAEAKPDPEPEPQNLLEVPSQDLKPTTFGQLLRQNVEALFPENATSFTLPQIKEIIRLKKLDNRIFDAAKLPADLASFTRDQAVYLTMADLTTLRPGSLIKEKYTRWNILQNMQIKAADLDRWSNIIGFSWKKDITLEEETTVDHQTGLHLRGLGKINARGLEIGQPALQA